MDRSRPVAAYGTAADIAERRQPVHSPWLPWLMSTSLHGLLLLICLLLLRQIPRGTGAEVVRDVGIATVVTRSGKREYFEPAAAAAESSAAAAQSAASAELALPASDSMAAELSALLPGRELAVGGAEDPGLPGHGRLTEGSGLGGSGRSGISDGAVRTEVFGVAGVGTKFVYVFDRSSSMAGFGGRPMQAAKSQLQASLADLGRLHQFQIIFYNQRPRIFHPFQGSPRLVWGDDDSKQLASRFIAGIEADGGTRHLEALRLAMQMHPDVIFFLTDADEPHLTSSELRQIRNGNDGATINAIEFGFGPSPGRENFLKQLARQNRGAYAYVDISRWQSRSPDRRKGPTH